MVTVAIEKKSAENIQMNENSRVWIHTSNRKLTPQEVEWIEVVGGKFASEWAAHGSKLTANVYVMHQHFVITVLDESNASASGCSIDKLIHWLQGIGNALSVDFFDRKKVAFLKANNSEEVILYDFTDLKQLYDNNQINDNDLIFNPLIDNLRTMKLSWMLPFQQSRYFSFVNQQE